MRYRFSWLRSLQSATIKIKSYSPASPESAQISIFPSLIVSRAAWPWHATTLLVNTRYGQHRAEITTTSRKMREEMTQPTDSEENNCRSTRQLELEMSLWYLMPSATPLNSKQWVKPEEKL